MCAFHLPSVPASSDFQIYRNFSSIILEHHQRYVIYHVFEYCCNVAKEKTRLARRSIFGYFCRRCFVSYVKLSYGGLSKLREDYQNWCSEGRKTGYEPIPKDNLTSKCRVFDRGSLLTQPASYLIHKTQVDKKTWAKPDTYAAYVPFIFSLRAKLTPIHRWEKARAVGDESVAVESIRSFFEQHFHDQSDSYVLLLWPISISGSTSQRLPSTCTIERSTHALP